MIEHCPLCNEPLIITGSFEPTGWEIACKKLVLVSGHGGQPHFFIRKVVFSNFKPGVGARIFETNEIIFSFDSCIIQYTTDGKWTLFVKRTINGYGYQFFESIDALKEFALAKESELLFK